MPEFLYELSDPEWTVFMVPVTTNNVPAFPTLKFVKGFPVQQKTF